MLQDFWYHKSLKINTNCEFLQALIQFWPKIKRSYDSYFFRWKELGQLGNGTLVFGFFCPKLNTRCFFHYQVYIQNELEEVQQMVSRRIPSMAVSFTIALSSLRSRPGLYLCRTQMVSTSFRPHSLFNYKIGVLSFCSSPQSFPQITDSSSPVPEESSKRVSRRFSLSSSFRFKQFSSSTSSCRASLSLAYIQWEHRLEISRISPYGTCLYTHNHRNRLAIDFRNFMRLFCKCSALRVLSSAAVILSEDTRHSGKLLHHYNIKTPLVSILQALICACICGAYLLFRSFSLCSLEFDFS